MIAIINRQKTKLNNKLLRRGIKRIMGKLGAASRDVSFVFCGAAFMRRLNRRAFGYRNATDVIAFPLADKHDETLGEVVVCVAEAKRAAPCYQNSFKKELWLYIIHGILHLLGYRDRTKKERQMMEQKQTELLKIVESV